MGKLRHGRRMGRVLGSTTTSACPAQTRAGVLSSPQRCLLLGSFLTPDLELEDVNDCRIITGCSLGVFPLFLTKQQQGETTGGEKKWAVGPCVCWGDVGEAWHSRGVISTPCRGGEPALSWAAADSKPQPSPGGQLPAVREERALQADVSTRDSSPPSPGIWGLPGLLPQQGCLEQNKQETNKNK